MQGLESKYNRRILLLFFISIFSSTFYLFFQQIPILFDLISNADELIVLSIFVLAILKSQRKGFKNFHLFWILFLFIVSGVVGNMHLHSSPIVIMLGCFITIKPILLFWSLSQFDFSWDDFYYFAKCFTKFFYVIVFAYLLDALFPGFRGLFGREIEGDKWRGGLRALSGIFYRPTFATIWAIVYYIIYRYYAVSVSKWKYYFAIAMNVFSFKVKDLLGFFLGMGMMFFKKITNIKVISLSVLFVVMFLLYTILLPEHFELYFGGSFDDSNIARVVLTYTSLRIGADYFPFGVGFGMFGSPISRQFQSDVYQMYHIDRVYGLDFVHDGGMFMCDTFWPMLLGENGVLGVLLYLIILLFCFGPFFKTFIHDTSNRSVLFPCFLFVVLLVETIGKPVFVGPPHSLVVWGIAGIFYSLKDKPFVFSKQYKL